MAERRYRHILIEGGGLAEPYTSPPRRGADLRLPPRNREGHGKKLLADLDGAWQAAQRRREQAAVVAVGRPNGVFLEFRSEPTYDLLLDRLERRPSGIELCAVRKVDQTTYATVFVPDGKLQLFVGLVEAYLQEQTKKGQPKNKPLVDGVSEIRLAALQSFWTDAVELFPPAGKAIWWEVWLRGEDDDTFRRFEAWAATAGLRVQEERLFFPERVVALAYGTREQLTASVDLLDNLGELRLPGRTPHAVLRLPRHQQQAIAEALLRRISVAGKDAPVVCLLETGVNHAHPLLAVGLDGSDLHTCRPAWGTHDHQGHGTQMAGLALYGDLTPLVAGNGPIVLGHRLESVKLLPPTGGNDPKLFGALTIEAIGHAEVQAPERRRAVCMAITDPSYSRRGQPSSWSAALDKLCSGADDDHRRLILVSAGNTEPGARHLYPDSNLTESIHDPAQSWNALTVGGFASTDRISDPAFAGWTPVAAAGGLCPSSTTSSTWVASWPMKPDIVMDGGNMALDPGRAYADHLDDLQLLTTDHQPIERLFAVAGETSAATALGARMAATIYAEYPDFWPETVRAMMVHSAEWTPELRRQFCPNGGRTELSTLLRTSGYGVPSLGAALWSAGNALTLLVQDEMQPFDGDRMKEMKLHELPWPKEVLQDLGAADVEMRVTLSYFVEPNPAERGWQRKFRYMSHGLRFDVKTPAESANEFRKRLNKAAREEEERGATTASDASKWLLGPILRHRGSIHSDRWFGTAAELAGRGLLGIYPVIGWWRERHQLGRSTRAARYALVVTIRTAETEVDIYTPVASRIGVPVVVTR